MSTNDQVDTCMHQVEPGGSRRHFISRAFKRQIVEGSVPGQNPFYPLEFEALFQPARECLENRGRFSRPSEVL